MKRILLGIALLMAVVGAFTATGTAANRGPAEIDIFGGSRGKVPFPHARHQDRIGDCDVCHQYCSAQSLIRVLSNNFGDIHIKYF
ncbi:cytochrome c3 family protein [Desulfosarcina ovata]|uniref:Uncharacterized protein n=1 Tax=Desulfosarcina ovata subsp. ovata TaxID=2752305 RepID=A0A5K8AEW3_9BACT|nr:cytochrome c3 family protein [Desulfosarcina ovata]BBO91185.1 hypothetical protein DSCOOX_43650 [Desulfosarcina ovata subsp. ovata]